MHLSYTRLPISNYNHESVIEGVGARFIPRWPTDKTEIDLSKLDEQFFYSVPTSFFVLDVRIPKVLRKLMSEAEGSLKSNFLTGASACARKVVYELGLLHKAAGDSYDDRIKSLKLSLAHVDPAFFDTLLTIQQVTSEKVHEESYDGWQAVHLRLILLALAEALHEIYVVPKLRAEKRKAILDLKNEVIGPEDRVRTQLPVIGSSEE